MTNTSRRKASKQQNFVPEDNRKINHKNDDQNKLITAKKSKWLIIRLFSSYRLLEIRVLKKSFQKKKFDRIIKIRDFFEHALILREYLVLCIFELMDAYHINLILIILPSRGFPFEIFLRFSKLWSIRYICLTKLLPTMTSIWLNYINIFWLFRKCIKTCFCMRKHIDISKTIINFLILWKQKIVTLEEIVIY